MKHIKEDSPFTISAFICQAMCQQKYWLLRSLRLEEPGKKLYQDHFQYKWLKSKTQEHT